MRSAPLLIASLFLAGTPVARAAGEVVEFGLVVCQQQEFAAPVAALASMQSSQLLIPTVADSPAELPPYEGQPCALVLSDLTKEGYELVASTPIARRSLTAQENFLRREQPAVEKLEWTIRLQSSIAILTCDPLADRVVRFSDGAAPSDHFVPEGASCAVHLAAILAQGGQIIGRHPVAASAENSASGPVTAYTAYELIHRLAAQQKALPRIPRTNNGRGR